jgi:hypothetical protein
MAQMSPRPPPPTVRDDPKRTAELAVYEALDHSHSDGTPVFHGLTWLAKRREDKARDAEADFLIVERHRSLLLIEVKGGRIARDGETGR